RRRRCHADYKCCPDRACRSGRRTERRRRGHGFDARAPPHRDRLDRPDCERTPAPPQPAAGLRTLASEDGPAREGAQRTGPSVARTKTGIRLVTPLPVLSTGESRHPARLFFRCRIESPTRITAEATAFSEGGPMIEQAVAETPRRGADAPASVKYEDILDDLQ